MSKRIASTSCKVDLKDKEIGLLVFALEKLGNKISNSVMKLEVLKLTEKLRNER